MRKSTKEDASVPSRRSLLYSVPAAAIGIGVLGAAVSKIDPVFSAIDRHKAAFADFERMCSLTDGVAADMEGRVITASDRDIWERANEAETSALIALFNTVPQTSDGCRAMIEHAMTRDILDDGGDAAKSLLAALLKSPVLAS